MEAPHRFGSFHGFIYGQINGEELAVPSSHTDERSAVSVLLAFLTARGFRQADHGGVQHLYELLL